MGYKPFEKYSDMSFDQDKFNEASTLAKAKYYGVKAYNETMEYTPSTVGFASGAVAGASLGSTLGSFVGAPHVGAALYTPGGARIGAMTGDAVGYRLQSDELQAELADDIAKFDDRFLRASIIEARASRAASALGLDIEEELDTAYLQDTLQDDKGKYMHDEGARSLVENYAAKVAIMANEQGLTASTRTAISMEYEDFCEKAEGLRYAFDNESSKGVMANQLPQAQQLDVRRAVRSTDLMAVAEFNALDYYAQMKVGEAMLEAEERGETLSDEEMNTIGEQAVKDMDKITAPCRQHRNHLRGEYEKEILNKGKSGDKFSSFSYPITEDKWREDR